MNSIGIIPSLFVHQKPSKDLSLKAKQKKYLFKQYLFNQTQYIRILPSSYVFQPVGGNIDSTLLTTQDSNQAVLQLQDDEI